jgi:pimeloyl-ACP methyl ester carboxylesterase
MPQTDDAVFYQLYFQAPGVAEAELEHDARLSVRGIMVSNSGDAPPREGGASDDQIGMVPRGGALRALMGATGGALPSWLSEADLDVYAAEFTRTGFRGGLNWYRNIDRNWELLAPFAGAKVSVPALYVVGERDLVLGFRGAKDLVANLSAFVPLLDRTIMLQGCGHWTQQERPAEVNAAMIAFLRAL